METHAHEWLVLKAQLREIVITLCPGSCNVDRWHWIIEG